ncbi:D-ribose pyranase [Mycoplasma sp. P36-A1]|uniref:D-ribose pyranase n=1 Tax=Mycoplasma sp. P36-A1 TaxID=3252900 RepID=UPI003C3090F0
MKKHGILNREINSVLGCLGHTDQITIADCGLPFPDGVKVIDLTLKIGTPSFLEVLELINDEMKIEKIIYAKEIEDHNHIIHKEINKKFTNIEVISHEQLKKQTAKSKVIIRTGEATPYANIILQSGVIF